MSGESRLRRRSKCRVFFNKETNIQTISNMETKEQRHDGNRDHHIQHC